MALRAGRVGYWLSVGLFWVLVSAGAIDRIRKPDGETTVMLAFWLFIAALASVGPAIGLVELAPDREVMGRRPTGKPLPKGKRTRLRGAVFVAALGLLVGAPLAERFGFLDKGASRSWFLASALLYVYALAGLPLPGDH